MRNTCRVQRYRYQVLLVAGSYLNGGIMVVNEVVLDILKGEGRLAHATITQHHNTVSEIEENEQIVSHEDL